MKKIISIMALLFLSISLKAQDVIIKKSGDEIQAKVLEVSESNVRFKKFDNLEGPIYELSIVEIFMIKYQNGTKDVFKAETIVVQKPVQEVPVAKPQKANGPILIIGERFMYKGSFLNDRSVLAFMKADENDLIHVNNYEKGWLKQRSGSPMVSVGVPMLVLGILFTASGAMNEEPGMTATGLLMSISGGTLMGFGIAVKIKGKAEKVAAVAEYNKGFGE